MTNSPIRSRNRSFAEIVVPLAGGLLAFLLYESTNAPGLFWGDAGEFLAASGTLGIGHAYGHPLFWLLGRIAILLDPSHPAAAMNHLVALISGVVGGLVASFARQAVENRLSSAGASLAALTVAGLFATGTTFWTQATFVEVYNVHALFVLLAVLAFHRYAFRRGDVRFLYAAAFFWGVSLTLGMYSALIVLLPAAVWIRNQQRPRIPLPALALTGLFLLVGLSSWLYLFVRSGVDSLFYWDRIRSLQDFFAYLERKQFSKFTAAGPAALGAGLSATLRIVAANVGVGGGILLALGIGSIVKDRRSREFLPYLVAWPALLLAFGLLIPLTLTFRQMVDMDVYFLPAFLLGIPVLALGASLWIEKLKPWTRPVLLLPVLLVALTRWNTIDLSDKSTAPDFAEYLTTRIPRGARVFPVSDEVAHPLLYHAFALGRRGDITLPKNSRILLDDIEAGEDGPVTLVEIDDLFLETFVRRDDYVLAGPFIAAPSDSLLARSLETGFVERFSPANLVLERLHRLDRMSLARIWARRGVYWFYEFRKRQTLGEETREAYEASLECLQHGSALDDFSFEGAQHAGNLALTYARGNRLEEARAAAVRALSLNPREPEAHRALYTVAVMEREYEDALYSLRTLSRLLPADGETHVNLAGLYLILSRPEEARKAYERALSLGAAPRAELEEYLNRDLPGRDTP